MECHGWKDGHASEPTCPHAESCSAYQAAPDLLEDKGMASSDKMLGR